MTFFNAAEPLLRSKQEALDVQDLYGLWRLEWKLGSITLFQGHYYTRIDLVFILWGAIVAVMFGTAQFLPLPWDLQAIVWSVLTLIGTVGTVYLTWYWAKVENLLWVVWSWVALMLLGLALTDGAVFYGWGQILISLCPLWLSLCGLGYLITGVGIRSRTFSIAGLIHALGIVAMAYFPAWQFLLTGVVMAGSLFLLAQLQWDMRPPRESDVLTLEQKEFNQQQYQLRQASSLH